LRRKISDADPANCRPELRRRLEYDDERLLAECQVHTFRARGPGGQKRNKTSSAVRLHHLPSGLIVKAAESRSQQENKNRALRRLRMALAVCFRCPLPEKIRWPPTVQITDGTLRLRPGNPAVPQVVGLILDALNQHEGRVGAAAAALGISTSSLVRFLREHRAALAEARRLGTQAGWPAIRT
jgi:hypothetical protein